MFGPAGPLTPGVAGTQDPHSPAGTGGAGALVTFTRSGLGIPWDARFNLEFAEAFAMPARWSCRTGVCHNSESGVIAGRLLYSPEPLGPPPEGGTLICCSTPMSDVVLDL